MITTSHAKRNKKESIVYMQWCHSHILAAVCCFLFCFVHLSNQTHNFNWIGRFFFFALFLNVTAQELASYWFYQCFAHQNREQPHQFNQKFKVQFHLNIEANFFSRLFYVWEFFFIFLRHRIIFVSLNHSKHLEFISFLWKKTNEKKNDEDDNDDSGCEFAIVINLNVSWNKFTFYWWMPSVGISDWQVN